MPLESTLLLVDLSNVLYRGLAMNDSLEDGRGRFTGGLYGFIIMLAAQIRKHRPVSVILCADSPPYLRNEIYPDYKGDRDRSEAEKDSDAIPMHVLKRESMGLVIKLCTQLKLPVAAVEGFEADDLIAHFVDLYYDEFDKILIDSNDTDLEQVLDVEHKVALLRKKGPYYYADFLRTWDGLTQRQMITALAMMGTHNAVEGIHGIGIKTAIKKIKSLRMLAEMHDTHGALIARNENLIELPWAGLEDYNLESIFVPDYKERPFLNFLAEYDIKLTDNMSDAFEWLGDTVHDII